MHRDIKLDNIHLAEHEFSENNNNNNEDDDQNDEDDD